MCKVYGLGDGDGVDVMANICAVDTRLATQTMELHVHVCAHNSQTECY